MTACAQAQANRRVLEMWTICRQPRDLPGVWYCARLWNVAGAEPMPTKALLIGSLEELREDMEERGLSRIQRFADDDPAIVEVWL